MHVVILRCPQPLIKMNVMQTTGSVFLLKNKLKERKSNNRLAFTEAKLETQPALAEIREVTTASGRTHYVAGLWKQCQWKAN